MKIEDITQYLEQVAPLHYQESYDNAGLLVGRHDTEIKGVLVSLDTTAAVVDEAIERGCNLIVAHHPIIFGGLKKLNGYHYVERAVIKAIKHDVAIYAIHTNLDNVLSNGVNEKIGLKLGLENLQILKPKTKIEDNVGSGVVGTLARPLEFHAFLRMLIRDMVLPGLKYTDVAHEVVQKVALCGGSGRFLLEDAIAVGAQVFISADFKYHEYFEANGQITIIDIGHYESEKFTVELLHQLITRKFSKFAAYCAKVNTNPINYKYNDGNS
jgi:dinuclear metal center YbgI/SA1388 family protein